MGPTLLQGGRRDRLPAGVVEVGALRLRRDVVGPVGGAGRAEIGARIVVLDGDDADVAVAPLSLDQPGAVVGAEIHDRGGEGRRHVRGRLRPRGLGREEARDRRRRQESPVHGAVSMATCRLACRTFTT